MVLLYKEPEVFQSKVKERGWFFPFSFYKLFYKRTHSKEFLTLKMTLNESLKGLNQYFVTIKF